jgi:hypothetical protein
MDHPHEPYERKLIYSDLVVRDEYNAIREQDQGE